MKNNFTFLALFLAVSVFGQNKSFDSVIAESSPSTVSASKISSSAISMSDLRLYGLSIKTDTILVDALCQHEKSNGIVINHWLQVDKKAQERQLEWRTWDSNTSSYAVYMPKSDWVVTKIRYLDNVDGCFELTPIKNE